jgi:hypothetical protein
LRPHSRFYETRAAYDYPRRTSCRRST